MYFYSNISLVEIMFNFYLINLQNSTGSGKGIFLGSPFYRFNDCCCLFQVIPKGECGGVRQSRESWAEWADFETYDLSKLHVVCAEVSSCVRVLPEEIDRPGDITSVICSTQHPDTACIN